MSERERERKREGDRVKERKKGGGRQGRGVRRRNMETGEVTSSPRTVSGTHEHLPSFPRCQSITLKMFFFLLHSKC